MPPRSWQHRKVYDTLRWRRVRELQLSRQPLCEACLAAGFTVAASVVDHKIPLSECGIEKAFDLDNLRSLCKPCHDVRTGSDKRRISEAVRVEERKWRDLIDEPTTPIE